MEKTPDEEIVEKVLCLGELIAALVDQGNDPRVERGDVSLLRWDVEKAVVDFRIFAESEFRIRRGN
jgi:hypothetical protein